MKLAGLKDSKNEIQNRLDIESHQLSSIQQKAEILRNIVL